MKTIYLFTVAVVLCLLSSCTRNNGDIGELFGLWRVTSIEINGEELDNYGGTMYFAFQTTVFCQKTVIESTHEYEDRFATWKYEGKDIVIDFHDYLPYEITGMQEGSNHVIIEKIKGKDMVMSYTSTEGVEYKYILKRW